MTGCWLKAKAVLFFSLGKDLVKEHPDKFIHGFVPRILYETFDPRICQYKRSYQSTVSLFTDGLRHNDATGNVINLHRNSFYNWK